MKKVYFLDFCDPKVFNGKGKFVATSKARNDVTSIVKRCLETIYVPIIRHSTNKVFGPLEIIIRIYLALLKIPKGSYVPRIQQASAKLRNVFVKALLWC